MFGTGYKFWKEPGQDLREESMERVLRRRERSVTCTRRERLEIRKEYGKRDERGQRDLKRI